MPPSDAECESTRREELESKCVTPCVVRCFVSEWLKTCVQETFNCVSEQFSFGGQNDFCRIFPLLKGHMVPFKYLCPSRIKFTVSFHKHLLCKLDSGTAEIHSVVGDSNHLTNFLRKAVCRVEYHHNVLCMCSESPVDLLP